MKKLLTVTILALSFATGFTCSKQPAPEMPPAAPPPAEAPAQDQMGVPAEPPPADALPPENPSAEGGSGH